ncbi:MAG: ATP-binding protein [Candidatus Eremiobacteraeota bacterium]|nr:ATP-binding protein [Candidatus Eremiobacteraeota bacterium]
MNPAPAASRSNGVVRLEIPAVAEWVAVARLAVAAVASRRPFSVDDLEDIKLAAAEACTNAIQHGPPNGTIAITCEVSAEGITISVSDRGHGAPLGTVAQERIGDAGRTEELGVFLIRALMDTVEYTSDVRNGTQLVMTKRISR